MLMQRLLDTTATPPEPSELYTRIAWPDAPPHRPYLYMNMVSTADGKIVVGEVGGTAKGVGGPTDQLLFRRLQMVCDAALLGSATLRASHVIYPAQIPRFVVTRGGDVPLDNRFFTDAPDKAFVLAPENLPASTLASLKSRTNVIQVGSDGVDLTRAMQILRQEHGIRVLLCEGGAALNDQLIRAGLADELFLTIAPKLKGGSHLPTVVDGPGFAPNTYLPLELGSLYHDDGELYLRYRLAPTPVQAGQGS